jgi:adenine-specific DNA-methyltransferase
MSSEENHYLRLAYSSFEEMTKKLTILFMEYLNADDLRDICQDIGLLSTGRMRELSGRIMGYLRRKQSEKEIDGARRIIRNTMDRRLNKDTLQSACMRFNLDATGARAQLFRKIYRNLDWPGVNDSRKPETRARKRVRQRIISLEDAKGLAGGGLTEKRARRDEGKPIEQYQHKGKQRVNNPPVGLVDSSTDVDKGRRTYSYDPHLDPSLFWAGKSERTSFDVHTVSLHVHERVDPRSIVEAVRKRDRRDHKQMSLFEYTEENPPLREAIEFYKHKHNWSNRLIAGDSVLVMNSLLEKEGMAGKVQMVYIDPPYGIKYGSNFQPFVNKRDVTDGSDDSLTQEPEMIKAFRDTWELGIHSYLTYLRDRILLARDLLNETGSVFVQISDENVHLVRCLLDEIFGKKNFVSLITFRKKTMPLGTKYLEEICDYLLFYAKNKEVLKFHNLFKEVDVQGDPHWNIAEFPNGKRRALTKEEIENHSLVEKPFVPCQLISMSPIGFSADRVFPIEVDGEKFLPANGKSWKTDKAGAERLKKANRLVPYESGDRLRYLLKLSDYPLTRITALWSDTSAPTDMHYVVETSTKVVSRCMLMTTDPGDLVLDPTCGSGTTAYVAENWGRRWLTCDTSRVAISLARQRLMTAVFDYYELARPQEGVGSGFNYKVVPHVNLKCIANNEPAALETLYDQPLVDSARLRVSGPFTVEAVPSPVVRSLSDVKAEPHADSSISRSGETLRQAEWRDELLRTGIRGKGGQKIEFSRVETLGGARWLHADAETKGDTRQRVVISFGPEYAPIEPRQVELAIEEAQKLVPRPKIVVFAAFQYDPEAAKDIEETKWPGVTLLKAQMNADLLTADLKKERKSDESFWLIGQPDVDLVKIKDGTDKDKYVVEVRGFDYYNTRRGMIESGGTEKIALWMLDPDYDGRSLFPKQVFFPMSGEMEGWSKLARNLKGEIDEDLIEAYRGTKSLPFEPGNQIAVKIIDDRGIESLKIVEVH